MFEELLNENCTMASKDIDIKIDGFLYDGYPLTKEEFMEKLDELGSLMLTDDEKYWVLYEERFPDHPWSEEIFWCIPKEEVHFILYNDEWLVWEESEEYEQNVAKYNEILDKYSKFEHKLSHYIMYDKRADAEDFRVWKKLQAYVNVADPEVSDDNKVCLITWLEEDWNAWLTSVMDETYKYMNLTGIVLESWIC